jgi:hypothetical protein
VRVVDNLQTTIELGSVNHHDQTLSLTASVEMVLPMPAQDEHLPEQIESAVHQTGLELQRRLFKALIEKADSELVLRRRDGKADAGIQRRGTRPYTFKTTFGEVTCQRARICHKHDGSLEIPSATAWNTADHLMITQNLRDAICDHLSDQSMGRSRADVGQDAGDPNLLGRSTITDILHRAGRELVAAHRARAQAVLAEATAAQLSMLGPAVLDPEALSGCVDDDPPWDQTEPAADEPEPIPAEWIVTGFPGCEPTMPVARSEPRAPDEDLVVVEPDEVKTKAQPSMGRKENWTYTAVVLVAGLRYAFAAATAEGLWLQVAALLLSLGVLRGARRLLVLGDGGRWIRTWFEGLRIDPKTMILCWWHLRKRCYEGLSLAGLAKDRRRALEKQLLQKLWNGDVDAALECLQSARPWVRNWARVEELRGYLQKRRAYIPDYEQRHRSGLWIASTAVEKFNDWSVSGRCKHQGMSWSSDGVLALAALEAARRNGELEHWRRHRVLPPMPALECDQEAA